MNLLTSSLKNTKLPVIGWEFSLRPFLSFTRKLIEETDSNIYKRVLEYMVEVVEKNPDLLQPFASLQDISKYPEVSELLLLSQADNYSSSQENALGIGIMNPVQFIGLTDSFRHIMDDLEHHYNMDVNDCMMEDEYMRQLYNKILRLSYHQEMEQPIAPPAMLKLKKTGHVTKHYNLIVNNQFAGVRVSGPLQELRQEWIDFASGLIENYEDVAVKMDFGQFTAEGFLLFKIVDVTEEEALAALSATTANMHTMHPKDTFRGMHNATISLLGKDTIETGLLPFINVNGSPVNHPFFHRTSVLYKFSETKFEPKDIYPFFYNQRSAEDKTDDVRPLIYNANTDHLYSSALKKDLDDTVKSMAIFPVWHQDNLLGILEVISTEQNGINQNVLQKMKRALPMYREFLVYQTRHLQEDINRLIMDQYTAIHPSVKWKFNEAAWQQLSSRILNEEAQAPAEIGFEQLLPFYGAVDIRNSSVLRQQAIRKDFSLQLSDLEKILQSAKPINGTKEATEKELEEIGYWWKRMEYPLNIEEETSLQAFVDDSAPLIKRLQQQGAIEQEMALSYNQAAVTETSPFHEAALTYEHQLENVNNALKKVLDVAEETLQTKLPHYFEHFKSDGWEFNIYAGKSIAPWLPFPDDVFSQISRWQLETMIDLGIAAKNANAGLDALETTQLIYTHATPINIHFRADERHFDVDGSYSIRYEVIKKRIDKALVLQTGQRLTQPGTIAIVYGASTVAQNFEAHIHDLVSAGKLEKEVEHLELEPLQGVSGLKALRVKIIF